MGKNQTVVENAPVSQGFHQHTQGAAAQDESSPRPASKRKEARRNSLGSIPSSAKVPHPGSSSGASNPHNAKTTGPIHNQKYKLKLCQNFEATGKCPYNEKCQFAHGRAELEKWAQRRKKAQQQQQHQHLGGGPKDAAQGSDVAKNQPSGAKSDRKRRSSLESIESSLSQGSPGAGSTGNSSETPQNRSSLDPIQTTPIIVNQWKTYGSPFTKGAKSADVVEITNKSSDLGSTPSSSSAGRSIAGLSLIGLDLRDNGADYQQPLFRERMSFINLEDSASYSGLNLVPESPVGSQYSRSLVDPEAASPSGSYYSGSGGGGPFNPVLTPLGSSRPQPFSALFSNPAPGFEPQPSRSSTWEPSASSATTIAGTLRTSSSYPSLWPSSSSSSSSAIESDPWDSLFSPQQQRNQNPGMSRSPSSPRPVVDDDIFCSLPPLLSGLDFGPAGSRHKNSQEQEPQSKPSSMSSMASADSTCRF